MYEVELKVPADLKRVRDRLEALEATPRGGVVQVDTYYDAPHRSFPETDEALRIRSERPAPDGSVDQHGDGQTRITYKGPLVDEESKTREEVETEVGDDEKMDDVLTNLGFEPAATVRKVRDRFTVDGTNGYVLTVTLDRVDEVGEYVEVETEVERESDLESARTAAAAVLAELDLDPDEQIQTSYLGLLLGA
ncbi:class IV adenylate cyclase [Natronobacterium gregoryi]|uniref:Adenylyl cyclase CyaB n=2 Tax=Natronobacterium gregoryi TaxID=44930 RepID=L0AD90_NATGS|nr:class IV adenylate cyclase [Natronobacterium gregoryi]AFZ71399.1 adenylyl cyclase CyaB, putative [Natronobacterium gregoryi SP2]ELY66924.1 adenylyl cyclase CyaB [Natronobacterium gregoryi SP2]PLK21222.1 class IV adenylate cyclase [Natronobacterium gregoryi SP2]SFI84606.1 adenylate cyclase [Natronobacterium gregoryi]